VNAARQALLALGHAFIADQADHDELVDRWARTLQARAEYRDDRVRHIAGRNLCRGRGHPRPGLRGCTTCRADIAAAWNGQRP
jgi:hypothetical protein